MEKSRITISGKIHWPSFHRVKIFQAEAGGETMALKHATTVAPTKEGTKKPSNIS